MRETIICMTGHALWMLQILPQEWLRSIFALLTHLHNLLLLVAAVAILELAVFLVFGLCVVAYM